MTAPQPNPQPASGAPAPQAEPKKTRRLGDFELIGKLGQGAMGAVYLARQVSANRQVALKLLPQDLAKDAEFLERFQREARAASKLSHPNIVAAYGVGIAESYHYIAMEYIDGPNLEHILQKRGKFSETELLKVAKHIASALGAAQAAGIVHRDIKPANILMTSQGISKLTDLGLASASAGDQRVTMAGYAVGTPFYISPEQARGTLDVDFRADIYSFGATLYHLSTGTLPFPGTNPVVIMTHHLQTTPQPPHEREPSVSVHVSALIQKMMCKDPGGRHQSAAELIEDIERCQRGEAPVMKTKPATAPKPVKKPPAPTNARAKAAPPPASAPAEAAGTPAKGFDEKVMAVLNKVFSFAPENARLPIAAGLLTVLLVALLILIVILVKR